MKKSSVHMTFRFGCNSKRPDVLMEMRRYFISGSVYMIFYHLKWNFNDRYEIHNRNEFQRHMRSKHLFILPRVNFVYMKISCRFETSFWLKRLMWNPYRFEFHFVSIHVNTRKELTKHRSEIFNQNEISYRFEFILPIIWI